jgi:hypothetical protein
MKPDIDLEDPRVKHAIQIHRTQMERALVVPQRVESAVLPIYHTLKSPTRPEQIGTGVVVCLEKEYFVFSASHVFDVIGNHVLLIGIGGGERLIPLSGERFSTKKGQSGTHGDDPIDASVFHIQQGITDKIKDVALSLEDLDLEKADPSNSVYIASGFRVKKSNTKGKEAKGERECFPSIEYGKSDYSLLEIDKNIHIALVYENQVLMENKWQTSPTPQGISGGAIIKVVGVGMKPPFKSALNPRQMLSAITIEQRREKNGKPGVLLGTRVEVHLSLINNFLPGFLEKNSKNESGI